MTSTSRSILSSSLDTDGRRNDEEGQWEVLDFSVFERSVARKLTDEDVRTILTFINITGRGLEPLWGTVVLKHIDLGLVGQHESPVIKPEPMLSESEVIPILDSIIGADGSAHWNTCISQRSGAMNKVQSFFNL